MFTLEVTAVFSAAHAIVMRGTREALHGHDWNVTACIEGDHLDADGLLVDFHAVQSALLEITGRFHHANLNRTPPFDRLNPTAEHIARFIADSLQKRLQTTAPQRPKNKGGKAPKPVRVASVRITEAPGCAAVYRPPIAPRS